MDESVVAAGIGAGGGSVRNSNDQHSNNSSSISSNSSKTKNAKQPTRSRGQGMTLTRQIGPIDDADAAASLPAEECYFVGGFDDNDNDDIDHKSAEHAAVLMESIASYLSLEEAAAHHQAARVGTPAAALSRLSSDCGYSIEASSCIGLAIDDEASHAPPSSEAGGCFLYPLQNVRPVSTVIILEGDDENDDGGVDTGALGRTFRQVSALDMGGPTMASRNELVPASVALDDEATCDEPHVSAKESWRRHRKYVQGQLTSAVMAHPYSVRSYCVEAHVAARAIARKPSDEESHRQAPEETSTRTAQTDHFASREEEKSVLPGINIEEIVTAILEKVLDFAPVSVAWDAMTTACDTVVDTTTAVARILVSILHSALSACCSAVQGLCNIVAQWNPLLVLEMVLSGAVERTGEALASGIQSVATGVGSAQAFAIHRLSAGGSDRSHGNFFPMTNTQGTATSSLSSRSLPAFGTFHGGDVVAPDALPLNLLSKVNFLRKGPRGIANTNVISDKMFRRLRQSDSTYKVLAYLEKEEEAISQTAKKRVQKMMHYQPSLRPFMVTVEVPRRKRPSEQSWLEPLAPPEIGEDGMDDRHMLTDGERRSSMSGSTTSSDMSEHTTDTSSYLCSPKSFPQTPTTRSQFMASGNRFADDVVFLARDRLRVEDGLHSKNAHTRAMASALKEGTRLAVFSADCCGNGIQLTCGQHCATKVGNDLYCSTRSMIPILRNCYVYFEMSVAAPPGPNMFLHHASLSVGLSTMEMPANTLVGAWKGSMGLCTTGQVLAAGQWRSPVDAAMSAYHVGCTVGCLVYLNDQSIYETWDGLMVAALVTYNVNGNVVAVAPWNSGGGNTTATTSYGAAGDGQDDQHQEVQTALPLFIPLQENLYPTLTLHSFETQVLSRFSAQDVLTKNRSQLGAPPGVTIYGVDGSVLMESDENEVVGLRRLSSPSSLDSMSSGSDCTNSPR